MQYHMKNMRPTHALTTTIVHDTNNQPVSLRTLLDTEGDFNLITSKIYKRHHFKKGNKITMSMTTANNTTTNNYETLKLRKLRELLQFLHPRYSLIRPHNRL